MTRRTSGNVASERSQPAHLQDSTDSRVRLSLEDKAPQGSLVIARVTYRYTRAGTCT